MQSESGPKAAAARTFLVLSLTVTAGVPTIWAIGENTTGIRVRPCLGDLLDSGGDAAERRDWGI
jgi:hypothetical protein